ncbi:signal peptidase I [Paenibacillus castaneae]|uniref:signal peptidase I n=1 Tax=Paenibacillus castaneae TaxID=474957 RepID=UPI000C9ABFAD|nr:signal peptidase I [Paenibacillus castaneae]NIK77916.1 signal peptidase I [Paenibacillus castaneae]
MSLIDRGKDVEPGIESTESSWRKELGDWIKTMVIALAVVLVLHFYVFNLSKVQGHSMEPTLTENEWLFVNKIVYLVSKPKVGDVVILREPGTLAKHKKFLVKRIVGMPGDRIEVYDQRLYRNGELVEESYTDTLIEDMSYGPEVIMPGHYFVMGDNRHARASLDSRSFHAVSDELIRGRADFILWPFKEIRAL